MSKLKIARAYELSLEADSMFGSALDRQAIAEEVLAADAEYVKEVDAFNKIVEGLEEAVKLRDEQATMRALVRLRVQSMNLKALFENLTDELTNLVSLGPDIVEERRGIY